MRVIVRIREQKLYVEREGIIIKEFPVSTSRFGVNNRAGSYGTPLGRHRIYKKIGEGLPKGAVLKARKFTGEIVLSAPEGDADIITTRILWLEGLQEGVNRGGEVDTRRRYIYIHGTPYEHLIGKPASKGCIRMRNEDIIELFDIVPEGCEVVIEE